MGGPGRDQLGGATLLNMNRGTATSRGNTIWPMPDCLLSAGSSGQRPYQGGGRRRVETTVGVGRGDEGGAKAQGVTYTEFSRDQRGGYLEEGEKEERQKDGLETEAPQT